MTTESSPDILTPEKIDANQQLIQKLHKSLNEVILGQTELNLRVVLALLANGHVLLEGLPGLGKTELVKTISSLLRLDFNRIQFTPDLMPGDITGTQIIQEGPQGRAFVFHEGPVFCNLLLADEINRASPKTQSALLEAMQERSVTIPGETRVLEPPFIVLASQNPIDIEGTYPLPEAQLDRFIMKLEVKHVTSDILKEILYQRGREKVKEIKSLMDRQDLLDLQRVTEKIYLPQPVATYLSALVTATQPTNPEAPELVKKYVRFGSSPRGALALLKTARALALFRGKPNVGFKEINDLLYSVLNHRLILEYSAKLDGITLKDVLSEVHNIQKKRLEEMPESLSFQ